jgi:hypothetical protein
MAHELTHAVQQSGGSKRLGIKALTPANSQQSDFFQGKVSTKYPTIKDNLTHGIFDWVIFDSEARAVLKILQNEKDPQAFEDTLAEMEKDGLTEGLLDNISDADQITYGTLIEQGKLAQLNLPEFQ